MRRENTYVNVRITGSGCNTSIPADDCAKLFAADHYAVPQNTPGEINLNKASIPNLIPELIDEIKESAALAISSPEALRKIFEKVRTKATELVKITDPRSVILGRNTTDVLRLCLRLSGLMSQDKHKRKVLTTLAENPATYRMLLIYGDHSNSDHTDPLTTFSNYQTEEPDYPPVIEHPLINNYNIAFFQECYFEFEFSKKFMEDLEEWIKSNKPRLAIFSHVLRHNGRILPVKKLTKLIKDLKKKHHPEDPEIFVCIDGAMALGNVPQVNFQELGVDMYVASPHKTMCTPAIGVGYLNPKHFDKVGPLFSDLDPQLDDIITPLMFHPELGAQTNTKHDVTAAAGVGFLKNLEWLEKCNFYQNGDFSRLDEHRKQISKYLQTKLKSLIQEGINIQLVSEDTMNENEQSSFIYSFRLGNDPGDAMSYTPG